MSKSSRTECLSVRHLWIPASRLAKIKCTNVALRVGIEHRSILVCPSVRDFLFAKRSVRNQGVQNVNFQLISCLNRQLIFFAGSSNPASAQDSSHHLLSQVGRLLYYCTTDYAHQSAPQLHSREDRRQCCQSAGILPLRIR
jgi:hypothetical protein